jgi:molecular chaperone GrpE
MKNKKDTEDLIINGDDGVISDDLPDVPRGEAVGFSDTVGASAKNAGGPQLSAEELKAQLEKSQKDYLYLRAEFDNYRRQAIKERSELLRYAGEKLARDLLDTLDIFETALASEITPDNYMTFVKGIELTAHQLRTTLNKYGIQDVPSHGEAFDPSLHEALGSEHTDLVPVGHVSQVFKKPYKYHDKVLRTGQVIVAKPKDLT